MAKNKAYVVWVGGTPGVYNNWNEVKPLVDGYPGARYKGFPSREAAEAAYEGKSSPSKPKAKKSKLKSNSISGIAPKGMYLTVDAAFSHKTNILEWRGVLVAENEEKEVFRSHAYRGGSANVGEFLAIIDGIEFLKFEGLELPIYSDSFVAQTWVKKKAHKSSAETSDTLGALLNRANKLLKSGIYEDVKDVIEMKDWKTKDWGEIAADFGRKSGRGLEVAEGPVL